jgi:hypothetical protein
MLVHLNRLVSLFLVSKLAMVRYIVMRSKMRRMERVVIGLQELEQNLESGIGKPEDIDQDINDIVSSMEKSSSQQRRSSQQQRQSTTGEGNNHDNANPLEHRIRFNQTRSYERCTKNRHIPK